jgi:predicted RNA-binding protein
MNPEEDAKVRNDLHQLARSVDRQLPYGWGFVVLAFPFGAGGRMNYISNAERPDIVRVMYEFIEATKGKWGEHIAELGAAAEDEQIGRARQRIAELEGILREAKEVIETLSDHGSAAEAMRIIKAQQAEIERLKGQQHDEDHCD